MADDTHEHFHEGYLISADPARLAHGLNQKLGFEPLAENDRYMILRPLKPPSTGG